MNKFMVEELLDEVVFYGQYNSTTTARYILEMSKEKIIDMIALLKEKVIEKQERIIDCEYSPVYNLFLGGKCMDKDDIADTLSCVVDSINHYGQIYTIENLEEALNDFEWTKKDCAKWFSHNPLSDNDSFIYITEVKLESFRTRIELLEYLNNEFKIDEDTLKEFLYEHRNDSCLPPFIHDYWDEVEDEKDRVKRQLAVIAMLEMNMMEV